jgi:hypothetical protein
VPPFSALGSLAQASAATEEESWAETCTHMARFITEHYLHIDNLLAPLLNLQLLILKLSKINISYIQREKAKIAKIKINSVDKYVIVLVREGKLKIEKNG